MSNKTHYSPTDPAARNSVKTSKARKLNFMNQLSIYTGHHVISDIRADDAYKKDNQCALDIVEHCRRRLKLFRPLWRNSVADTGYSSGENYVFLDRINSLSLILLHGMYNRGLESFVRDLDRYDYVFPKGEIIPFKTVFKDYRKEGLKKASWSTINQYKDCLIKRSCLGKRVKEKKLSVIYFKLFNQNLVLPHGFY
jgi:hypothetical protein